MSHSVAPFATAGATCSLSSRNTFVKARVGRGPPERFAVLKVAEESEQRLIRGLIGMLKSGGPKR